MLDFFRKNLDKVLTSFAILFLIVLIWYFVVVIVTSTSSVSSVFGSFSKNTQISDFNLQGAQKLNLRGLIQ